jgi:hypothetical protein
MRLERVLMIAVSTLVGLIIAPAAGACEIQSLSVSGGSGGVVRPGDTLTYSLVVKSTEASPGESAGYVVSLGSDTLGRGTATINDGGSSGTFTLGDLGSSKRQITISAYLDNGTPATSGHLNYDGTAAAPMTPKEQPAGQSAGTGSTPSSPGTSPPAQSPASGPSTPPRAGAPGKVVEHSRALTEATRPHIGARPVQTPARLPVRRPEPVAVPAHATAAAPAVAAHRSVLASPPAAVHPVGLGARRVEAAPARAGSPPLARTSNRQSRRLAPIAFALVVLLLAVGGGFAGSAILRRRRPLPGRGAASSLSHDLAVEAELQEMLAEHHAGSLPSEEEQPRVPV